MKECPKCGENKKLDCFYIDEKGSMGRSSYCKDCRNIYFRKQHKTPKRKYHSYRKNAKTRNYDFNLTMDQFMSFWNKDCSYCGGRIEGIGLDRMDNSIGYEFNNVVSCCTQCNMMKLKSPAESFLSHCKKVTEFQKLK